MCNLGVDVVAWVYIEMQSCGDMWSLLGQHQEMDWSSRFMSLQFFSWHTPITRTWHILRAEYQSMCQMTYTVALEFTRTEWPRFWSWKNHCFFFDVCGVIEHRKFSSHLLETNVACYHALFEILDFGGVVTSGTLQFNQPNLKSPTVPQKAVQRLKKREREVSCFRAAYILRRCHKIYQ